MKSTALKILRAGTAMLITALMVSWGIAQAGEHQKKNDSNLSVSGTVIVKKSQEMSKKDAQYFLDNNNDGKADYQLQWNQEKADFTAPKDGVNVTILGTMSKDGKSELPILHVSELQAERASSSDAGSY